MACALSRGLLVGLEDLCRHTATHQLQCRLAVTGEQQELPDRVQDQLYRIARKAASNAVKHSCATEIGVHLCFEHDALLLNVQDNGIGTDPAALRSAGYGIKNIRERARAMGGRIELQTAPEQEFSLRAAIPLRVR